MLRAMNAKVTLILNVSDMAASFTWFAKWGGGSAGTGDRLRLSGRWGLVRFEIFLCHGAQGGRGKGTNTTTFQKEGDDAGHTAVWMSVWVDDVDVVHRDRVAAGLEVTFPPTYMPWHVREMHLRHPDGHVFRVSRGIGEAGVGDKSRHLLTKLRRALAFAR